MAKVAVAIGATDFGPNHAVAAVLDFLDPAFVDSLIETWPASAGIEFVFTTVERNTARGAIVDAGFVVFIIGRRCRPIQCRLAA